MSDPFEDAATNTDQQAGGVATDEREAPAEDYPDRAEDRLFGGEALPSIFTKKHDVGDVVEFTIKGKPFEKHSYTFVEGERGEPKYWGEDNQPTTVRINPETGKARRPVMDLVIPLNTTYRFSAAELETRGLTEDDGSRGWYISSAQAEKEFKAALRKAGIRSMAELIGAKGRAKRTGKVKRAKGSAWTYAVEFVKA